MTEEALLPSAASIPKHALLATIVASSFDAIISKSLDGTILSWNAAAERIFGYSEDEAVGRSVSILHPPHRLQEVTFILERLRLGETIESFETERLRTDGRLIHVAVMSSPVRDHTGKVVGASKIVRDITELRATVTALAQHRARVEEIVESAMDAIVTVDETEQIVVFNLAAAKMFRCDASDALGQPLSRFIPARFREFHGKSTRQFPVCGQTPRPICVPGDICGLRSDGEELPLEAAISHSRSRAGALRTVIMRDISELRRARSERTALETQLREAQKMEAVGTLAGGIAHDFNNIVASILGNAGLAREQLSHEHPCAPLIAQIEGAAKRARSVVRQIMAFSRRQPQALTNQPLEPIIKEVLELLRATLPASTTLACQPSEAEIWVPADATQIHQVLLNLCTNAWQALHGRIGRIELSVKELRLSTSESMKLSALPPGLYAQISIRDNGSGMDEHVRNRIFEPFFTTKPRGEGTGLGLSVVHRIVVEHGGAITVESAPGQGSTFHVYLPSSAAETFVDERQEGAKSVAIDGRGRRVMYIDDDEVMVVMVERLLTRSGFTVACYQDATIALAALRANSSAFDVIVTDYNMPDKTGLDVAREVAEIAPTLRVVITSGYLSDDLRSEALACGATLMEKENTFEALPSLLVRVTSSH